MTLSNVPFWSTLWPTLVATTAGVAIGLLAALGLYRLVAKQTQRREELKRRRALARTARALRETVIWNGENAASLAEELRRGKVPVQTRLEVERWEALRKEFLETAQDPELQGRVAFFFDQVRRAAQLAQVRFEFGFGVSSEMSYAPDVEAALHGQLTDDLPAIAQEAPELDALLQRLEASA